jgi:hypothetical protein
MANLLTRKVKKSIQTVLAVIQRKPNFIVEHAKKSTTALRNVNVKIGETNTNSHVQLRSSKPNRRHQQRLTQIPTRASQLAACVDQQAAVQLKLARPIVAKSGFAWTMEIMNSAVSG